MAATAWAVYNLAKKKIGNSTLNLAATVFRMTLHTSASNVNTATLNVYGASVTGEVVSVTGAYSTSGKPLVNEVWTNAGTASAGQYKFDADDVFWSALTTISNIKFAVIWLSAAATANRHLLCRSSLSTAQFTLATGNRMTVQMAATGILLLN
jgi:hypothetical protein